MKFHSTSRIQDARIHRFAYG